MPVIYRPKGRALEYSALACNVYSGCDHACTYCLTGDTLILKADLSSVPLSDVEPGDTLLGVITKPGGRACTTKFATSTVLAKWIARKPVYEVRLRNGMSARCSADHRWLTDRGWKFTTGCMSGPDQRPYLTRNNFIRTVAASVITPAITDAYKRGYLSGIIRGDGHVGHHGPYERKEIRKDRNNTPFHRIQMLHQFLLRLSDVQALERAKAYLAYFGISTFDFSFNKTMAGIRTSRQAAIEAIEDLIAWHDSPEYHRGFLAGIFDAEGSHSGGIVRITNSDPAILAHVESGLGNAGFRYVYDQPHDGPNTTIQTIRIQGGLPEYIRFCQWCDPAISRKRAIDGRSLKGNAMVVSITPLGYEETMFDIQTSTETFIANGMVSHNCYAPEATYKTREQFGQPRQRNGDFLRMLAKEAERLAGSAERVLLCFTCDPYQRLDVEAGVTRKVIQTLHAHGIPVQVLTKGGRRALRDLDLFTDRDAFATTMTLLTPEASAEWEPGAATPQDRIDTLKAFHAAGIPTWVSLEPVLNPAAALEIIRRTHEFVDLFKLGKLNYHELARRIDWRRFGHEAIALLDELGKDRYIKKDLQALL